MTQPATDLPDQATRSATDVPADAPLLEDVLVEEVSIDGMCGVY